MESNELKAVYDALLSAPGMEESVKIDLRIDRKRALFLVTVIENGLEAGSTGRDLLSLSSAISKEELHGIANAILEKAGLSEMQGKLKKLGGGK